MILKPEKAEEVGLRYNEHEVDIHAFDGLVGVIDVREDGSEAHDKYITSQTSL